MPKYEVMRPWHGVRAGDVVEIAELHPALRPNVRELRGNSDLTPATPTAPSGKQPTKGEIAKRLKELEIGFDGRQSATELMTLLPDGDPLKGDTE